jgi:Uma2 family endonuclease
MRTLLPDPPPDELRGPLEQLLERRRKQGIDIRDEVWEGVLHMNPVSHWRHAKLQAELNELLGPRARAAGLDRVAEINIGEPDDFRVPDGALTRPGTGELWNATAALIVEVLSPGDETWQKLPFYAARGVQEALIIDPDAHAVQWFGLTDGDYEPIDRSRLIELGPAELTELLDWPD